MGIRLGLIFEVKVGNGKLLVSGVDLMNNLDSRLAAKQLLASLQSYMSSKSFNPSVAMEIGQIESMLK